jgi:hypothetical protein
MHRNVNKYGNGTAIITMANANTVESDIDTNLLNSLNAITPQDTRSTMLSAL